MKDPKVYVGVQASFDPYGRMIPIQITWEDGTIYDIDRIIDTRQAATQKAGSGGDRYTVSVCRKQTYLFFERCAEFYGAEESRVIGRWFAERR